MPRESIRWSGAQPVRDLESALLVKLEPGAYTAVVRGHQGGTGVGLIERSISKRTTRRSS
jgi:hypothetical protein